ncbi:uncharacterized protein LOC132197188 [Neocloeon triangulifer]|uniref:uncharacterized protein LOC132197188 n=1 Tax=Neocloeon triangulifer TaxID=2078957 RepID=UPI00286EC418|nr:uncharacterized protein LOC132197188 [Neocloeon triangulifer]
MGSTDTLVEIKEENIPHLQEVLKSLLPDTVMQYYWILTHLEWKKEIPKLQIKILCLNGDWNEKTVICLADGLAVPDKIYGVMYAPEEKLDRLKSALLTTDLIEWPRLKQFSACLLRLVPMMAQVFKEKGYQHNEDEFTYTGYQYYMPVEEAKKFPLPTLPENVRVGSLDGSFLDVFCSHWRHYDPEYRPVVQKMLELNLSVGVFVKNERGEEELASMVLQSEYGGVGLLQTVPEFRRKGYAEIALAHLTKQLGLKGFMPFTNVLKWNEAANKLFKKFGYKLVDRGSWIIANKLPE